MDFIQSVFLALFFLHVPCWLGSSAPGTQGLQAGNSSCISDSADGQLCQGYVTSLKVASVTFQEAVFLF